MYFLFRFQLISVYVFNETRKVVVSYIISKTGGGIIPLISKDNLRMTETYLQNNQICFT